MLKNSCSMRKPEVWLYNCPVNEHSETLEGPGRVVGVTGQFLPVFMVSRV